MVTSSGVARDNILQAAADMVCTQGEGGLRVAAVAAAAAVNKRMIYHYFGDRQGLLRALYQQQASILLDSPRGLRSECKDVLRVLLGRLADELPMDQVIQASQGVEQDLHLQRAAKILLPYLVHQPRQAVGTFSVEQWRVFSEDVVSLALPGWSKSKRSLTTKKPVFRIPSASRPRT